MTRSRMRYGVAGVLLTFVLAMVIGLSGVAARGGSVALAASTTLTVIGGDVQVSRAGGAYATAPDGTVLAPGDVIRTGVDGRAVLTYFEGSTVTIEPGSELAIERALAEQNGDTVVVMTQNLGRTWHVVTKLITGGSRYEVKTPAATASVRGTAFEVGVARSASGVSITTVVTTEGAVAAAAPPTTADPMPEPVIVPAGFQTQARETERKPDPPTPAPEPERKVTVNVGAANSLVVDPLGRANGFKDGKLVIQTPGAEVRTIAGTLIVTMPNVPDGNITTFVGSRMSQQDQRAAQRSPEREVEIPVITTVQDKGAPRAVVQDSTRSNAPQPAGVELKKGDGESAPDVRQLEEQEKRDLPAPKVGRSPDPEPGRQPVFRPGLGESSVVQRIAEERRAEDRARESAEARKADDAKTEERRAEDRKSEPARPEEKKGEDAKPASTDGGFRPNIPLPPAPAQGNKDETRSAEQKKVAEAATVESRQFERAATDAQRLAAEAQRQSEEARRRAEDDRRRAEQQAIAAAAAKLQAEAERKKAEEEAAKAADAAKKLAAQQEAARQAEAARIAEERQKAALAAQEKAAREAAEAAERARRQQQAQEFLQQLLDNRRRTPPAGQQQGAGQESPPPPAQTQPPAPVRDLKPGTPGN